jgi:hypothetical protein
MDDKTISRFPSFTCCLFVVVLSARIAAEIDRSETSKKNKLEGSESGKTATNNGSSEGSYVK